MEKDIFQSKIERTANIPNIPENREKRLLNGALGLCGEAGEVAEIIKKTYFQGHKLSKEDIKEELGDVLWYFAFIMNTLGLNFSEVMEANVQKLNKRYPKKFTSEKSINREL